MRVIPIRRRQMKELLRLKGWTKRHLAKQLGLSENAIYRWFIDREPSGPASVLMRGWLTEARKGKSMPAAG